MAVGRGTWRVGYLAAPELLGILDLQDIVAAPDLKGVLTSMTVLDLQDIVAALDLKGVTVLDLQDIVALYIGPSTQW